MSIISSSSFTTQSIIHRLQDEGWKIKQESDNHHLLVKKDRIVYIPKKSHLNSTSINKVIKYTKEDMYALHPDKWLLVNEPVQRKSDGEIISGQLLGISDKRETVYQIASILKPKSCAIINSIQEEN